MNKQNRVNFLMNKPGIKAAPSSASRFYSGTLALTVWLALLVMLSGHVTAGEADVVDGKITALGADRYRIDATVKHADTGWEHYADRWDVITEDGSVLGVRELAHPHENEQPFTRSLTLSIPSGVTKVILRANDSVHGLGGLQFELTVPAE